MTDHTDVESETELPTCQNVTMSLFAPPTENASSSLIGQSTSNTLSYWSPNKHHRWFTSEEIYSILIATQTHREWITPQIINRPDNGSVLLFDKSIKQTAGYRKDGYVWRKRKDGKHTREDHMKLRIKGNDCIYGCYAHSAVLPSFHRRFYQLLDQPNIILVHYLNVTAQNHVSRPSLINCDKKHWKRDELFTQLVPMYRSAVNSNESLISDALLYSLIDELIIETQRGGNSNNNPGHVVTTAQWVLSLHNNGSYRLEQRPTTDTNNHNLIQGQASAVSLQPVDKSQSNVIPNTNIQLVVQTLPNQNRADPTPDVTCVQPSTSSDHMQPESLNTNSICDTKTSSQTQSQLNSTHNVQNPGDGLAEHSTITSLNTHSSYNITDNRMITDEPQANNRNIANNHQTDVQMSSPRHAHTSILEIPGIDEGFPDDITQGFPAESTDLYPITADDVNSTLSAYLNGSGVCDLDLSEGHIDCDVMDKGRVGGGRQSGDGELVKDELDLNGLNMQDEYSELFPDLQDIRMSYTDGDILNSTSHEAAPSTGEIIKITALGPEWSYSDGGCKVLLVGCWPDTCSRYTCKFGDSEVECQIVQCGVLTCITPPCVEGMTTVRVYRNSLPLSDVCSFEYRAPPVRSPLRSWFTVESGRLRHAIVDKINSIKGLLNIKTMADPGETLEQRILQHLNQIQRSFPNVSMCNKSLTSQNQFRDMTLLHLASGLGYKQVVSSILAWGSTLPYLHTNTQRPEQNTLAREIDLLSVDSFGASSLHWSISANQPEISVLLYTADYRALDLETCDGQTPRDLARKLNYTDLLSILEGRESVRLSARLDAGPVSPFRRSVSPTVADKPPAGSHRSSVLPRQNSSPYPLRQTLSFCSSGAPSAVSAAAHSTSIASVSNNSVDSDSECSIIDIETVSELPGYHTNTVDQSGSSSDAHIRALAESIIAAMPDRIKNCSNDAQPTHQQTAQNWYRERSSSRSSYSSALSCTEDSGVSLLHDWTINSTTVNSDLFYPPNSSHSFNPTNSTHPLNPGNSSHPFNPANSSHSFNPNNTSNPFGPPPNPLQSGVFANPNSAPTTSASTSSRVESPVACTKTLGEYFNAGQELLVEYGLSQLTLSDVEQRKLYQAACIIQNAFRQFKGKKQQQKEIEAAVIIQTYYRRFKEFTTLRNIRQQEAATRIQSQFRSYYAQKRFKKSRDAALLIQHHYRAYREHEQFKRSKNAAVLIQQKFRTHYNRKKSSKQLHNDSSSVHMLPPVIPVDISANTQPDYSQPDFTQPEYSQPDYTDSSSLQSYVDNL